jgi:hypothetical protein
MHNRETETFAKQKMSIVVESHVSFEEAPKEAGSILTTFSQSYQPEEV